MSLWLNIKKQLHLKLIIEKFIRKQSGGRGKFADIVFTVEPAEEGKQGLEFISNIKGGNVPKEFIPSVEKGFKMAMQNGPLAGYEVDSLKVTLNMMDPIMMLILISCHLSLQQKLV